MTGAQVGSGEDISKSPSTLFTSNKAINFSDRNTAPSESDLILNSSQALMNEGFKKKAILEWEISPIRQPPTPKKQQNNIVNLKINAQNRCDTLENVERITQIIHKYTQNSPKAAGEVIQTEQNQENIQKGQHSKKSSLSIQNKILSNILKKSTSHHISELNKQMKTSAGASVLAKQLKHQYQTTIQTTETTNQFLSQQFLRQRTNTQDLFYYKNTCTYTNSTTTTQQQQEFNQTQEQTLLTENNKANYLSIHHLIKNNDNPQLMIRDSIESIPSNFNTKNKAGHRSSNSFYNLLSKIQNNMEQNLTTKKEQHNSIKPQITSKVILSDSHFIKTCKNKNQQIQETIFPQTCKATTQRGQYQLADQQQLQQLFNTHNKYNNFIQKKHSLNIPIQELTYLQKQRNAQYFFPTESDNDSTPFAVPKNQFQYHYRDNSYQLIQNDHVSNPNQIASTRSQESTKNTDTERSLGRQRSNAYSSLAGNLDDIYKKLQNLKAIQSIQSN